MEKKTKVGRESGKKEGKNQESDDGICECRGHIMRDERDYGEIENVYFSTY